ncbi:MAG: helicase, partial [Pedobacter sp.]
MLQPTEEIQPAQLAAKFVNLTSRHIFLTGKAGTGKTTFLRSLISLTHKKAVIVAPTGIAAINAAGVTIHSLFQLPFGTFLPKVLPTLNVKDYQHYHTPKSIIKHLSMNATKRRILLDLELLIIDEVSMLRADLLDAIDTVLRYIRKNNTNFGGVQLLFIGDLHQLPPVVKNDEWNLLAQVYKSAYFFDALALEKNPPVYIELEKIYRQADETFINLLNNLRNNQTTDQDIALLKTYYKENYKPVLTDNYITLTTHNNKADTLNRNSLKELGGKSYFFNATIEKEFAESAFPAEKSLELKVGAQVMFIKNDPTGDQRFFNGKIAVVKKLGNDFIEVLPDGATYNLTLEKYTWKNIKYNTNKTTNEIEEEIAGTFTQYPLKLAWAITVHKSQGLTFDKAIIDIGDAFAPGQIYVALSRLRSLDGLVLTSLIANRGIRQDQNVTFFARTKELQEDLSVQIRKESDAFLKHSLMESFNFATLDNYVFEHVFSYTKDEKRSTKQTHLPWAVKLQQDLMALKVNADKFLKQIDRLFIPGDAESLKTLLERAEAAENYFNPQLQAMSDSIFELIETVKTQKQTKEYLGELIDMEAMFYEQYKKIKKAKAMLTATNAQQELTKEEVLALYTSAKREEQIKTAYTLANKEQSKGPREDFYGIPSAIRKAKVPKEPKEDTKEVTLALFKDGKNVTQIAAERKMSTGTIEGHLAYFVARQEVKVTELVPAKRLDEITATIAKLKSIKLNEVREALGKSYTFGEIKIGIAAYLA